MQISGAGESGILLFFDLKSVLVDNVCACIAVCLCWAAWPLVALQTSAPSVVQRLCCVGGTAYLRWHIARADCETEKYTCSLTLDIVYVCVSERERERERERNVCVCVCVCVPGAFLPASQTEHRVFGLFVRR
jgi:hypothetical protein